MNLTIPPNAKSSRSGFTLTEVLIVIAIIAILAALSVGAIFRFIGTQHQHNTEATINKVSEALDQQLKAVLDAAKTEAVPPGVLSLAGNNGDRARLIWIKLRQKQEFPKTFAEALAPTGAPNPYVGPNQLPGIYKVQVGAVPATMENAALLYMILKRARRGMVFDPDSLSSNELKDAGNGYKIIVDDWGTPLAFFPWPTGDQGPNVNGLPHNVAPGDPEARLADKTWVIDPADPLQKKLSPQAILFSTLCYPVTPGQVYTLFPVIASAGPDATFGLDPLMTKIPAPPPKPPLPPYYMDNIYSKNLITARPDLYSSPGGK